MSTTFRRGSAIVSTPDIRGHMALVADASVHTAELFARTLRRAGVGVLVAHTCPKVLEHLAICRFDLLVLDLELPLGGARPALERLQDDPRHVDTRAIVVASRWEPSDRWMAMLAGAAAFLTKPVRASELLETASAVLPRRPSLGLAIGDA